jgi:hypothetical protein
MTKRLRLLLPAVLTPVTACVLAWDMYLAPTRGYYDTGAPFWPYEMPTLLLNLLDAPARILALPFWSLFNAPFGPAHDAILLLLTPLVWYWIGDRFDNGLLRPPHRYPRLLTTLLLLVAALGVVATFLDLRDDVTWWRELPQYRYGFVMRSLREAPGLLWLLVIVAACCFAAWKLFRSNSLAPTPHALRDHRITLASIVIWLAALALTPVTDYARNYNHAYGAREGLDPDSCELDTSNGCIHGIIQTSEGEPIQGVYVQAIPLSSPPEYRYIRTLETSTDRQGRYSFDAVAPGQYLVGVHTRSAPNSEQPYPTTYYPDASDEGSATHLLISANQRINLDPMHLRSLPLTTFTVEVRWPDGSHPERSNLLVRNTKFDEAAIGAAPQIDDGKGSFTLPQNFEYQVHAAVSCDEGPKIGQRETAYLPLHVTDHPEPAKLVLTLPGTPCKIWSPAGH